MTALVKKAHSLGINYYDTAEIYGFGEAERQMGEALKSLKVAREDLVVSTKILRSVPRDNTNRVGLSRKHVIEGLTNSLKRLQLDYVDIVFCHRFDRDTPLEEVCRSFDTLIKKGLAHYWGTSEWTAAQIFEAFMVCERFNLIKPIVEQPQYNLLVRNVFEKEYGRLFDIYKLGSTVWSPLLGGVLTGKYNDGIPSDSRLSSFSDNMIVSRHLNTYFGEENKPKYIAMFKGLAAIAKELGCTQAQLSMAWVIKNKDVSTALTSASKPEQLDDVVAAVAIYPKITAEIEEKLNKLTEQQQTPDIDFRTFQPAPLRR